MSHLRARARSAAVAALRTLLLLIALASALATHAAVKPAAILVLGDSISAGYGLAPDSGWVTLLARRVAEQYPAYRVVNASISGDTTAGGRARLPALLAEHHPAIVIVELGGNDGLRGGDLGVTRTNLDAMIDASKKAGAKVLLVGMQLPPNYGSAYTSRFDALYRDAATRHKVALVPFLFEGFAADATLFQPDRIHPTLAAQPRLLDNVWPALQPLLGKPR